MCSPKTIKVTLKQYSFDTNRSPEDRKAYENLVKDLKARGLKCFSAIGNRGEQLNGEFEIETKILFDNQYNTVEGVRIFEWREPYDINHTGIKVGYYIDSDISELREAQNTQYKCNYCGRRYSLAELPDSGYCTACRGSEYLTPKEYKLLKLTPVVESNPEFDEVPESVISDIKAVQKEARKESAQQTLESALNSAQKTFDDSVKSARLMHEATLWLVEQGFGEYADNLIYYNHNDRFCFGWRNSLSSTDPILDVLTEFPFDYDIKKSSDWK